MVGILAFILIGAIIVFIILYRNASGQNLSRYVAENTSFIYDKFAVTAIKFLFSIEIFF